MRLDSWNNNQIKFRSNTAVAVVTVIQNPIDLKKKK